MMLSLVRAVRNEHSYQLKMLIAACTGQVLVDSLVEASHRTAEKAEAGHLELKHSQCTAPSDTIWHHLAPSDTI